MKKSFTLNYGVLRFRNFNTTLRSNQPMYNNGDLIIKDMSVQRVRSINCKYERQSTFIQSRGYAIKFYTHPYERKSTFSHLVLNYIKSLPEYSYEFVSPIASAYNERNTIEQLQSVVIHGLPPEQDDIVRLFSLYVQSSRSTLSSVLLRSDDVKKLKAKFECAIPDMSSDHLLQLARSLNLLRYLRWNIFIALSSDVYDELLNRVTEYPDSVENILKHFIITMELYGDSVYKKKGYNEFIKCFENSVHEATPAQVVHIMHFIGLIKTRNDYSSLLWSCISHLSPNIKNISFIEAGIAAAAIYKSRLKLPKSSSFVINLSDKLNESLVKSQKDVNSFGTLDRHSCVSILKILHKIDYQNKDLLTSLRAFLLKCKMSSYDPPFICNCLAYFSNSNCYKEDLFTIFENEFFQFIESHDAEIRLKDISRAIWAFSNVNHPCKLSNLNLILSSLLEISKTADVLLGTKHFVDSLLALAIYGIYDQNLIKTIFREEFTTALKENNKGRPLSRLFLLYHIYKTFFPELDILLPDIDTSILPHRTIADELNFRPALKLIQNAIDWLNHECGVEVFKLKFLVPHIHNASLVISDEIDIHHLPSQIGSRVLLNLKSVLNRKIFVDINDCHVTVNGSDNIIGLETLKRNILSNQGWNMRIIPENDIINQNNDITAIAAFLIETFTSEKEI